MGFISLAPFTLRQVGQSQGDVSGIPRPEPKRVARKNRKAPGFPWKRRALLLGASFDLAPCKGALLGARWARLLLRRYAAVSEKRLVPDRCFLRTPPLGLGLELASIAD